MGSRFMLPVVKLFEMSEDLDLRVCIYSFNSRLLDDIQRLNLKTLKWEHIATLMNPIAAW
jgi:hypothetical protein